MIRTYSEMMSFGSFLDRFRYLKLDGRIGEETFGYDRYLNQKFYKTPEWRQLRDHLIVRDLGCDLSHPDFEIGGKILIHHMNPITVTDILDRSDYLMNPEYLVCVSHNTHQAIHYGDESLLITEPIVRTPNDTCPWR